MIALLRAFFTQPSLEARKKALETAYQHQLLSAQFAIIDAETNRTNLERRLALVKPSEYEFPKL